MSYRSASRSKGRLSQKLRLSSRNAHSRPKPQPTPSKAIGEFYALSNTGNIEEELRRGGRVVRVDMPRSSLFAMGVDLPLENDSKYIKTDLSLAADGVPRAIRFLD